MGLLLGYALSVCGDAVGFCLGDHVEVLSGAGDACVEEFAREKDVGGHVDGQEDQIGRAHV